MLFLTTAYGIHLLRDLQEISLRGLTVEINHVSETAVDYHYSSIILLHEKLVKTSS